MIRIGAFSITLAGLVIVAMATGAAIELGTLGPSTLAKQLTLASLGLLMFVIGNLLPKTSPLGASAPEGAHRDAGRVLVIGGLAIALFALSGPADQALLFGAALGVLSLALCAAFLLPRADHEGTTDMNKKSAALRLTGLLLLVGLAGAFGLILIDKAFGDQVAQWSAIIWVLILGVAVTSGTIALSQKN